MQPNNTAALCTPVGLHDSCFAANIGSTTKLQAARCAAVNSAFFVPKIRGICTRIGMKNRTRITQNAVGLIAPNKRPFNGNKGSRLVAVVETRPPVINAGGHYLTKLQGGHSYA